ncbi:hypothetical protein Dimus_021390, partial [Dionaea muscipula]
KVGGSSCRVQLAYVLYHPILAKLGIVVAFHPGYDVFRFVVVRLQEFVLIFFSSSITNVALQ